GVGAVQERARPGRGAQPRHERVNDGHEHEGRQENADGGDDRAGYAIQDVADESGSGEDGPRCKLTDGYSVQDLLVGQPPQTIDEVVAQEREQDVAAAIES